MTKEKTELEKLWDEEPDVDHEALAYGLSPNNMKDAKLQAKLHDK